MSRMNPTPAERQFEEGRLMADLVAPIVSEKGNDGRREVERGHLRKWLQDATKLPKIKAAVELMFEDRSPGASSVLNIKGIGAKRFGKSIGRRDNVRKAYVTLKAGQELNLVGEGA